MSFQPYVPADGYTNLTKTYANLTKTYANLTKRYTNLTKRYEEQKAVVSRATCTARHDARCLTTTQYRHLTTARDTSEFLFAQFHEGHNLALPRRGRAMPAQTRTRPAVSGNLFSPHERYDGVVRQGFLLRHDQQRAFSGRRRDGQHIRFRVTNHHLPYEKNSRDGWNNRGSVCRRLEGCGL